MAESIDAKARRYIGEGRLRVLVVNAKRVFAQCRGDETYFLGWITDRRPWCTCPARGRCCHLAALELVVDRAALQEFASQPERVA